MARRLLHNGTSAPALLPCVNAGDEWRFAKTHKATSILSGINHKPRATFHDGSSHFFVFSSLTMSMCLPARSMLGARAQHQAAQPAGLSIASIAIDLYHAGHQTTGRSAGRASRVRTALTDETSAQSLGVAFTGHDRQDGFYGLPAGCGAKLVVVEGELIGF